VTLPPPEAWPGEDPLGDRFRDLLRERAEATPDATALVDADTGESRTYDELDWRVDRRADALASLGIGEGDRIGTVFGTRPAFAEVYFAVARLGAALVPLNVGLPDDEIGEQADRAGVAALVCGRDTASRARAVAPDGAAVASVDESDHESVRSLALDAATSTDGSVDGTDRDRRESVVTDRDTERVVMFTSGTTGRPKGVRLTAGNLIASALGSADRLGVNPGDRWLITLPTYHMGGLAPLVRSTLYGTTAVIEREFDAETTAATLSRTGCTAVSLVPTMLTRLLDTGWTPDEQLRFVLLGGAPADAALIERCDRRGVPACPTYGLTETASQVATATPAEAADHPDSVGRPLSNATVTLRGDDGAPAEAGETGELVVDGPMVTPGYLDADATRAAFGTDGLWTGDLARRDEGGRLWIVGRADDVILTGGENVRPATVAAELATHDGVAETAVVGLRDPEWGERVAALVVPAVESLAPSAVEAHARDELADFAVPKTVVLADALPRTASGTVDRDAVRERIEDAADGD